MKGLHFWPRLTVPEWITALLLVLLVGFILIGLLGVFPSSFVYLLFVLLTVVVVRSVPVEPGAWLGLRLVRRALVVLIALITIRFLVASDVNLPAFVALVLCDFALGRATRRIASAPRDVLDERQDAWRNRAYQIAYVLFALAVGGVLAVADVATPGSRQWLAAAIQSGGAMISFFQLLLFLPSMVIAWREPDRVSDHDAPRLRDSIAARLAMVMVALCLLIPVVLSIALAVAPLRVSTRIEPQAPPASNLSCAEYRATKEVGFGVRATLPLAAEVCWDGQKADEQWGLNAGDCLLYTAEFATVSSLECRRTTGADGTLHYIEQSRVSSAFLPFISRDVTMRLDVTKDGKVVQFP